MQCRHRQLVALVAPATNHQRRQRRQRRQWRQWRLTGRANQPIGELSRESISLARDLLLCRIELWSWRIESPLSRRHYCKVLRDGLPLWSRMLDLMHRHRDLMPPVLHRHRPEHRHRSLSPPRISSDHPVLHGHRDLMPCPSQHRTLSESRNLFYCANFIVKSHCHRGLRDPRCMFDMLRWVHSF